MKVADIVEELINLGDEIRGLDENVTIKKIELGELKYDITQLKYDINESKKILADLRSKREKIRTNLNKSAVNHFFNNNDIVGNVYDCNICNLTNNTQIDSTEVEVIRVNKQSFVVRVLDLKYVDNDSPLNLLYNNELTESEENGIFRIKKDNIAYLLNEFGIMSDLINDYIKYMNREEILTDLLD